MLALNSSSPTKGLTRGLGLKSNAKNQSQTGAPRSKIRSLASRGFNVGICQVSNSVLKILPLLFASRWSDKAEFAKLAVLVIVYEILVGLVRSGVAESALLATKTKLSATNNRSASLLTLLTTIPLAVLFVSVGSAISGVSITGLELISTAVMSIGLSVEVARTFALSSRSDALSLLGRDLGWLVVFVGGWTITRPESAISILLVFHISASFVHGFPLIRAALTPRSLRNAYEGLARRRVTAQTLVAEASTGLLLSRVGLLLLSRVVTDVAMAEFRLILGVVGPVNLVGIVVFWKISQWDIGQLRQSLFPISLGLATIPLCMVGVVAVFDKLKIGSVEIDLIVLLIVACSFSVRSPILGIRALAYKSGLEGSVLIVGTTSGFLAITLIPLLGASYGLVGASLGFLLSAVGSLLCWVYLYARVSGPSSRNNGVTQEILNRSIQT